MQMQVQAQKKLSWWDAMIHGGQHTAFRLLSLIFSGASAWAIYWFFSALGDDSVQHVFTVLTSVGFVALGYFVTRGLAHRMMSKQRIRSYVPLAILYIIVEVSCNFAHAAAKYPDVTWIHQLQGWQLGFFSLMLPLVLSIIPLFNIFLAAIDVDLMQEKQGLLTAQPKQSLPRYTGNGAAAQASYPAVPAPAASGRQGSPNALQNWWNGKKPQAPAPVAPSSGTNGYGAYNGAGIP